VRNWFKKNQSLITWIIALAFAVGAVVIFTPNLVGFIAAKNNKKVVNYTVLVTSTNPELKDISNYSVSDGSYLNITNKISWDTSGNLSSYVSQKYSKINNYVDAEILYYFAQKKGFSASKDEISAKVKEIQKYSSNYKPPYYLRDYLSVDDFYDNTDYAKYEITIDKFINNSIPTDDLVLQKYIDSNKKSYSYYLTKNMYVKNTSASSVTSLLKKAKDKDAEFAKLLKTDMVNKGASNNDTQYIPFNQLFYLKYQLTRQFSLPATNDVIGPYPVSNDYSVVILVDGQKTFKKISEMKKIETVYKSFLDEYKKAKIVDLIKNIKEQNGIKVTFKNSFKYYDPFEKGDLKAKEKIESELEQQMTPYGTQISIDFTNLDGGVLLYVFLDNIRGKYSQIDNDFKQMDSYKDIDKSLITKSATEIKKALEITTKDATELNQKLTQYNTYKRLMKDTKGFVRSDVEKQLKKYSDKQLKVAKELYGFNVDTQDVLGYLYNHGDRSKDLVIKYAKKISSYQFTQSLIDDLTKIFRTANKDDKVTIANILGDAYYGMYDFQKALDYYYYILRGDPQNSAVKDKINKILYMEQKNTGQKK
jgi:hypothetical protein